MVLRVGINGFGRIGRITFRTCFHNSEIQLTAINDPAIDIEYICYLIKFDSTHGKFRGNVTHTADEITINDQKIKVFQEKIPSDVPWHRAGVQYVIEASGMFTSLDKASGHLQSVGVRRVIVTAPCVDVPMVILGVNDYLLDTGAKVISCASSTLYCLAPIIKVLSDHFGVVEGFVTSIHAMTPSLKPLDGLCLRGKHWRDHRSINQNIIPATTGACKALGKILPQVKDKLTGLAFRVPIINVSVLDITIKLEISTSIEDIVKAVEMASTRGLKNIISISDEDAVSSDFIGDSHSCILDIDSSLQLRPTFFKLICWYENEYSYACRVVDSIFFSEMQFVQSNTLVSKTTYVRTRLPKRIIIPKLKGNQEMTIQCKYINASTDKIVCSNSHDSIKSKPAPKPRPLLRKPLLPQSSRTATTVFNCDTTDTYNTKRRNEIFKVWNDNCNTSKTSIRQNRNSFFHSYITFSPKYPFQQPDCMKVQERLESVKREFSKMLIITEDLLKKSHSSKFNVQCLGTKEVMKVNSNVELKIESSFDSCPEDELNIGKRNYIQPKVKKQVFKECGDFKNMVLNQCNIGSSNNKAFKLKGSENVNNIPARADYKMFCDRITKIATEKTRSELHKDVCSSSIDKQSNILKPFGAPDIIPNKKPATDDTNLDPLVVKTIKSLTYAITSRVVANVFNELKLSSQLLSKKNYEENEVLNNIIKLEEDIHSTKERSSNSQNYEDKPLINKEKPNSYYVKGLTKNLPCKNYDMHIDDEKLKMRNIILMNSDSNNVLKCDSECSQLDTEDLRTNIDINKKILAGLRVIAQTGVNDGLSPCGSTANTVTTVSNGDRTRVKQDLYDKLDSVSESDSDNSFQINERKSQVLNIKDLTSSLEDLERLDKICRVIEISDELSDQLFSSLDNNEVSLEQKRKWSFKDLCERIKLDEFCNNVFGKSSS